MNLSFNTPEFIQEARSSGKGHRLWLEILIFIGVFVTGAILESIPSVVVVFIRLFSNPAYISTINSGDTQLLEDMIISGDLSAIISLFSTVLMIVAAFIYCRFIEKRRLRTMGFINKNLFKEYGAGLLIGGAMFSAAVLMCAATGTLSFKGFSPTLAVDTLVIFFLAYMVQGMSEEVLCRGYFMVSASRKSSLITAVIANASLFACLHLLNPGITVLAFVNLILFGVFASVYMLRRGSIWGVAAIHSSWNFVQGNLFGISVSGTGQTTSLLSSTLSSNGSLINGGAFGLEGGLAVTIVLAAGIAGVLFVPKGLRNR